MLRFVEKVKIDFGLRKCLKIYIKYWLDSNLDIKKVRVYFDKLRIKWKIKI